MSSKKIFSHLLFLLLLAAILSSCTPSGQGYDQQVFHYNQYSGISSLDPAFSRSQSTMWACNALYNSLVQLDSDLNIRPCLAQRWDISADGLVYTFHLRTDVLFHDDPCFSGHPRHMVAQDVLYSLDRIRDPHTASPGAWIFNGRVDTIAPFTAVNDSTFVLRLLRPFRPVMGILAMQYCSVIPHEAVTHYGTDFRSHPVGTGPFRFRTWREGSALILTKNENYFEFENGSRLPLIDGVRVSFMANRKTEFLSFKEGKLDLISGIDASFIDEVIDNNGELKPAMRSQFDLRKAPYLNTEYLGILSTGITPGHPLADQRVRQALSYGFDRRELVRFLRNGVGRPAENGFTPIGLPSFDTAVHGYDYQPDRARALLHEAGYDHHRSEIVLQTNENYKEMAIFICKQWERIGVHARAEIVEEAILREWMTSGKVNFFRGSWIADYPDAESYFTVLYGHNASPPNYTRYRNAEYDKIYETALAEQDDIKRYELYHRLERIIIRDCPVIPLYYDQVLRFTQKSVSGLPVNGMNMLDLKRVRLHR